MSATLEGRGCFWARQPLGALDSRTTYRTMWIQGQKNGSLSKKVLCLATIAALLFSSVNGFVRPGWTAGLEEIVVTNTRDHLLVYFTVRDCFTEEMVKAIDSGLPVTFTFFVRLYEVRRFWWDREISDLKVQHQIQYDNLKKLYRVRLSEKNNQVVQVEDLEKAKTLMSEIVGLKVSELHRLQKGARYHVHMMAELDKIRLPFYLHYVFFFLSLWDFETDWYRIEFKY